MLYKQRINLEIDHTILYGLYLNMTLNISQQKNEEQISNICFKWNARKAESILNATVMTMLRLRKQD